MCPRLRGCGKNEKPARSTVWDRLDARQAVWCSARGHVLYGLARQEAGMLPPLVVSGPKRDQETNVTGFEVNAIGWVESSLSDPESAPRQADEGAPEAWLVLEREVLEGLRGIVAGDEVIVLTW